MGTPTRLVSRRDWMGFHAMVLTLPTAFCFAGCGGEDKPKVEADTKPSGPIKPVPRKKGAGKNEKEEMFDPREALKKKGVG